LIDKICEDFVISPEELLASMIRDRDALNERIIELQSTLNHPAAAATIDNVFGKPIEDVRPDVFDRRYRR
jgi:hypothetical protein